MPTFSLHLGDCLETLKTLPDNSIDSVVCDPPYGLSKEPDMAEVLRHWMAGDDYQHKGAGFMGKTWDSFVPGPSVWKECLRVLKPGGHLLAFFGTRTQDMGTLAIRLAGFEIRDSIAWVYGSGFPKSMDVSKTIDKAAGAEREVIGEKTFADGSKARKTQKLGGNATFSDPVSRESNTVITAPTTDAARQWQGWGTALKPALEPITVARKPLIGTVAANVLAHGTGVLNIDGCRVAADGEKSPSEARREAARKSGNAPGRPGEYGETLQDRTSPERYMQARAGEALGRWPANLIHDGSDEVVALLPNARSSCGGGKGGGAVGEKSGGYAGGFRADYDSSSVQYFDSGSAARFFYCAKASRRDRNEGCEGMPQQMPTNAVDRASQRDGGEGAPGRGSRSKPRENIHPTVKPTDLMAYLCRLVTPPGGTVLDPFMGSGSTGKAAMREGFNFIGCELSEDYLAIARARITHELAKRQVVADLEQAVCAEPDQIELFAEGAV